jgi:Cu2+-exporting ATPase
VALPEVSLHSAAKADHLTQQLSLPGIHCVACMTGVEQTLLALTGVSAARVNLSLRRVTATTNPAVPPEVLMDALAKAGFEAKALDQSLLGTQSDPVGRALLTRIAVSGFAMMNVMLLSVAVWSGAVGATLGLFHLISASIAVPALLFAAQPFFKHAWSALRARRLNMDVPISLAIILAGGMSTYETFAGGEHAYFDAALSLTFFLLLGRYLDHRSRTAARSAAAQLSALEVPRIQRLINGQTETVDFADLAVGDTVVVLPGGRIPVDGFIAAGAGDVDRSMLTGESRLAQLLVGDAVTAGEISQSAVLHINASTVGEDTTLRKMVSMVDAAESSRSTYNAIADRAAAIYAPMVHLLALVAFLGWLVGTGDLRLSLNIAIAVLIITCPCALGLAVPAVSTTAAGRLFRAGLLVKDGTALERLAEVDTVVFDKTGTLTRLSPALAGLPQMDADTAGVALALARHSTHPVARVIDAELTAAGVEPLPIANISELAGKGIEAQWVGQRVRLGSGRWLGSAGATAVQMGDADPVEFTLTSDLRDGAHDLIQAWREAGLEIHILSGDGPDETAQIARELGVPLGASEATPTDKLAYIQALAASGKKVLMVGDGLNDTGALAAAFASISPASAADASRAASDIVLLNDSLAALADLPLVAREAKRRVLENFSIAAGYNAIAIPIALAGFATPLMAAIAMSASSITVVLNALRLRGPAA